MAQASNSKNIQRLKILFEQSNSQPISDNSKPGGTQKNATSVKQEINDDEVTQKYVVKDLLRTFIFIIFAAIILFASSIFLSDWDYAKNIRAQFHLEEVRFN